MILICINSDSSGNGYILQDSNGYFITIEAGCKISQFKQALSYDISKWACGLVSHAHLDHSKYINEILKNGINVYSCNDVAKKFIGVEIIDKIGINKNNFTIKPFELYHDVECYGYLISHPEMGRLVFITDSAFCKYKFKDINHFLVEANYHDDIIDTKIVDFTLTNSQKERLHETHFSLDNAIDFIKASYSPEIRNVVLLHLSNGNSNAKEFIAKTKKELSFYNVFVADKGLTIELNKEPF